MVTAVLDYSVARPAPADIKSRGYVGVMRYVAPIGAASGPAFGGADDSHKVIFQPEYNALYAQGLAVGLNWEWYTNRAREGASAGTQDATEALRQSNILGYTGALYFSIDYDAPPGDQPALNAYFQACAQVIGFTRLGCYGGYWPLSRLFTAGLISYGWQANAWSGTNRESRAHLLQTLTKDFSGQADIDTVLKPDWQGLPPGPDIQKVQSLLQQALAELEK